MTEPCVSPKGHRRDPKPWLTKEEVRALVDKCLEPIRVERPIDEWEECPVCQGTEGHYDGDEWVDCPHCQGQGGWSK